KDRRHNSRKNYQESLNLEVFMKLKAFTLIELLVVIAIILVLAGFLLPSLGKARERGVRAACVNNLRQIGTALQMYAGETGYYPGHYFVIPGSDPLNPVGPSKIVWPGRLLPYVAN